MNAIDRSATRSKTLHCGARCVRRAIKENLKTANVISAGRSVASEPMFREPRVQLNSQNE
jgi:hypothetical protein